MTELFNNCRPSPTYVYIKWKDRGNANIWAYLWGVSSNEIHAKKKTDNLNIPWLLKHRIAVTYCMKGNTGRFIMFSVITNIYNKKTKGPTLMELCTATGKLFFTTRDIRCVHHGWHGTHSSSCHTRVNMLTRVWQELEYRIDVCRVTRGAHIEHL